MKIIDLNNWKRKEHFEFFSQLDEPFYGLVAEIDCTIAYKTAKANKYSFFAYYLHKSLLAVNKIEEFTYRIEDGRVVQFTPIHATTTIGRADETFAYSFINFSPDFAIFNNSLQTEIEIVQNSTGMRRHKGAERKDVIHYSAIPWVAFTGLTHARNLKLKDSVPKISFGKAFIRGKKRIMPVAIFVHHGLVDGLHIGKYLELLQKLMNE